MANHSCRRQEAYCRVKALAEMCWFGRHVKCMEGGNNCACDGHQARCLEVVCCCFTLAEWIKLCGFHITINIVPSPL
ncbi:hypothetical protein CEXT_446911 [Caerostris extrusa]|uniref:Uncharacterized protein n=1 Tax=Caerostris extrusa TaxID=172846 RepID=A0AAV4RYQ9_CAEEX|nr:hypothetical protein CEXT_446911 [Caerostris extrusa]